MRFIEHFSHKQASPEIMINAISHILKLIWICVTLLLPSTSASAAPTPEEVLANAARYTVKVQTLNEIGLNQDDGGSIEGSGLLVDRERGWILTNAHVVTRSPAIVSVSFKNQKYIEAKRIHVDPFIDMAVIAIPPETIPKDATSAQLDCNERPDSGVSVFAFGHPWGLSYTASRGIVSGISWFYPKEQIQTDAVINSGNSGGPLIRASDGKIVGLNAATYKNSDDKNATAVGLAEPIPPICSIISLLRDRRDPRMRILPVAIAKSGADLRPRIAAIYRSDLGFKSGDIITNVNGIGPISSFPDLIAKLRGLDNAATVTVKRNGNSLEITSPLTIVPDPLAIKAVNISGMYVAAPWRIDSREVDPEGRLVVDYVDNDTEAGGTEAVASDTVVSVDGQTFTNVEELYEYLSGKPKGANVDLILRGYAGVAEYFMEYRHVTLSLNKLELVSSDF